MTATPLVLLDDARPGGAAWLYRDPDHVVVAMTPDQVSGALATIREGLGRGLHAAGFLAYEAAVGLDAKLTGLPMPDGPLVWFGLFRTAEQVDAATWLPDPAGAWIGPARPAITETLYADRVHRILDFIRAGDVYQANLTFSATVAMLGDPLAAYAALRPRAGAGYGAVVMTGDDIMLSLSPELFFTLDGTTLTARPMKGTALRADTPVEDAHAAEALAKDPKQRAENLMIVDLLRNDLSRCAMAGSVGVNRLFAVETYPTVHQMVSEVTATLAPGQDAIDTLAALFPCGSITGAPKLRAMQVVRDVEAAPRGIYTGAIGRLSPDGSAQFNVAIRTLHVRPGAGEARLGLGSGIVADSDPGVEWSECLAKARFLTTGARRIDLIETMKFDPHTGFDLLDRHLARMAASVRAFGGRFDHHAIRNALQAATFRVTQPARVRLLLSLDGTIAIEKEPMPAAFTDPITVALAPLPVSPHDFRLRHKTSDRAFYEHARQTSGADEVVLVHPDGHITEGSFTTLFVPRGDRLLTPPAALGLLPGVLRAELLETGRAEVSLLTPDDLSGGFMLGNALRGLFSARLL